MTLNGKRDHFTLNDFKTCAKVASLKRGRAETMLQEVQATVSHWPDYAEQAGVRSEQWQQIERALRLDEFT